MEMTYYLAVDIGASSGRHMLSHLEDGKLVLEEIYRFPNGMTEKNGHKVWDVERLFAGHRAGMKKCMLISRRKNSTTEQESKNRSLTRSISWLR